MDEARVLREEMRIQFLPVVSLYQLLQLISISTPVYDACQPQFQFSNSLSLTVMCDLG